MSEIRIAERIIVDEPQNVEIAIKNLTGQNVDFELIRKFIINESDTTFYIDRRMNSSTEYGQYMDYLWLDTGFRDTRNNPIMICLHNSYSGYVGHYTGPVKDLANRIKSFNTRNAKDIVKNYERFLAKYRSKAAERDHEIIADINQYAVDMANLEEEREPSALAKVIAGLEVEFAADQLEEVQEEQVETEEEFTLEQEEITMGLLFEQMEKMQNYIDELLDHIENNEKESQEEIARLQKQNQEYKKALVDIRTFMQEEERQEEPDKTKTGHNLLAKNEKILILGNTDIRVAEMRAIAKDYFGFEKNDFEFITDYEKIKSAGARIHSSERFAAVIFGNCPHKVARMGNYTSIIDEFKERTDCPIAIDARNEAGGLKITKQSFKKALMSVYEQLNELDEAC